MRFTKMHGLGNDYVYLNVFDADTPPIHDPAALARDIADRHFGVGGDGLILVMPPEQGVDAHVRMRMFNADGSEAEMCGNGIRCVCKLAHDRGITTARPMKIQTGRGVLSLDYTTGGDGKVNQVTVDMGQAIIKPEDVPVDVSRLTATDQPQTFIIQAEHASACVSAGNTASPFTATFVSMGNPHAVIYLEGHTDAGPRPGLREDALHHFGPLLERHPAFPRRMNIHFVTIHSPAEVTVQHWERGSGPTLACGTGACAVCVAGVLTGRTKAKILAHLPGGDLRLEYLQTEGHVLMTGPAVEVFTGEYGMRVQH